MTAKALMLALRGEERQSAQAPEPQAPGLARAVAAGKRGCELLLRSCAGRVRPRVTARAEVRRTSGQKITRDLQPPAPAARRVATAARQLIIARHRTVSAGSTLDQPCVTSAAAPSPPAARSDSLAGAHHLTHTPPW
eukprot:358658-Chlamydomonas_euryale.AAC.1